MADKEEADGADEKEDKKKAKKEKKKKKKDEAAEGEEGKEPAAEGEGAEGEEGAEGGKKKLSKKQIIIIAAVAAVVLIGGGVGAFFAFKSHPTEEGAANGEVDAEGNPIKAVYYTLPQILVNLNTTGKQNSFLKATVIFEVPNPNDVPGIEANLPRLQDSYNTYLRELRASDLSGSAGIQRLREELMLRANKALAPVKITDVLFKEIVVQ